MRITLDVAKKKSKSQKVEFLDQVVYRFHISMKAKIQLTMRTMSSRFTSVPKIRPKSSEKKISLAKVTSGYAVLKSQADRSRTVDFGLHRLRKNGSFSMNRRS